ncbi:hypothetical protein MLD38_035544 [Melastoma candidum]|uniref:Uncharacterized protein n=1 Tax=Melastoma candidum TaxID=119954 RepID=A0ACB9LGW3_9MYRT|nr:hypothetical protein MLD38_035544 [Melastoma candidum]
MYNKKVKPSVQKNIFEKSGKEKQQKEAPATSDKSGPTAPKATVPSSSTLEQPREGSSSSLPNLIRDLQRQIVAQTEELKVLKDTVAELVITVERYKDIVQHLLSTVRSQYLIKRMLDTVESAGDTHIWRSLEYCWLLELTLNGVTFTERPQLSCLMRTVTQEESLRNSAAMFRGSFHDAGILILVRISNSLYLLFSSMG